MIKFVPQRFLSRWHVGRVGFKGQVGMSMEAVQETDYSLSYSGMRGIPELIEKQGPQTRHRGRRDSEH